MNTSKFKEFLSSAWPHAIVLLGFAIVSLIYFSPVLKGMSLSQNDNNQAIGSAHELSLYEQQTGQKAQWTDSMFGGMPAYQIKADSSANIFHSLSHWIRFGLPFTTAGILFLYMVGFYILILSVASDDLQPAIRRWLAIIGALAFGLGSYNIIIIAAGHITKAYAIAMMPLVIGGVLITFSGRRILGTIYTMFALGLELAYNHVQISYYLALAILVLLAFKLAFAIRDKKVRDFGLSLACLVVAAILAILPSTTNLWTTYEYGAFSTRGASELAPRDGQSKPDSGLDKDYALSWSYGVHETPTLLIPNIVGGASEPIGADLKRSKVADAQIAQAVAQQSKYWGGRGFTSGPVYVGAIICFLFFIGCFFYDGREKWWLITATLLSLFLAWGKNFPLLTDIMFDYFPLYNKFRTVEMALVIATVTIPLLAIFGLRAICLHPEDIKYHPAKFFGAMGLTAGFCLIIFAAPTLFYDFLDPQEAERLSALAKQNPVYLSFTDALVNARAALASADALRSAVLILLASSAIWFYSVGRINSRIMLGTLSLLIAIDLWSVDRRYLSSDDFHAVRKSDTFALHKADQLILQDKTPHRVLAVCRSPFNDAITSYYHQSVGGYHGAKIRRYQDLIDAYLAPEYGAIMNAMQKQDYEGIDAALRRATGLNMLGTRYVIYNPDAEPIVNSYAQPRAWFVSEARHAADANEAIELLADVDLRSVAVIEGADCPAVAPDSTASVSQTAYAPDAISYRSHSAADGLVVFSEIYYPAGWTASIDGQPADILRADYVLRALKVPAGDHDLRFEFHPRSYSLGNAISLTASIIVVLIAIAALGYYGFYRKRDE